MKASRRRSTLVQATGNQLLMATAVVRGVVLVPLYLEYLGQSLYGAWLALAGAIGLLGLADLGVTTLVTQRVANAHGASNTERLGRLIGSSMAAGMVPVVLILVTAYPLSRVLPAWIGAGSQHQAELQVALLLAFSESAVTLVGLLLGSVLFGLQRPGPHMAAYLLGSLLEIATVVIGLLSGMGLLALPVGALTRALLVLVVDGWALYRYFSREATLWSIKCDKNVALDLLHSARWLFPAKLGQLLNTQTDALVVGKILGPSAVPIVCLSQRVVDFGVQALGRVPASFVSGLAHLEGRGESKKASETTAWLLMGTMYSGAVIFGAVLLFNSHFMTLWVGPHLYAGSFFTLAYCSYGFVRLLGIAFSNILLASGRVSDTARAAIAEASSRLFLGVTLCVFFGVNGVAVGALVSTGLAMIYLALALKERLASPRRVLIFSGAALAPIAAGGLAVTLAPPHGWLDLLFYLGTYVIAAAGAIVLLDSGIRRFSRTLFALGRAALVHGRS